MNAKQKKTLGLLLCVVVTLLALLIIILIVKRNQAADDAANAASSADAVTDANADYASLTYSNGTATLSFAKNEDGSWYWTDDPDYPLNGDFLTKITTTISGLTPQQTITDGDTLESYGLDSPAMTLTAAMNDETQSTFAIGNQVAGSEDSYYMLLNGDSSTVYIIDASLHSELSNNIYDMMALPQLPVLTEDQISSISVKGSVSTQLTSSVEAASASAASGASSSASEADSVTWLSGGTDVTSSDQVSSLIQEVSAIPIASCQDYKPSDKAVSLCGFDAPAAVVTVTYTDPNGGGSASFTLQVGSTTADENGYYVRLNDDTTIYSITTDNLSSILSVASNGLSA